MKDGPDIALIGSLIGDPARANMLTALMSGKALTSSELAHEAGVTLQTASSHLGRLVAGGLLLQRRQGRHRYYTLAGEEVGSLLETLMGLAAKKGHLRTRTGPKDPALRKARICYDHLAGDLGVRVYDSLRANGHLVSLAPETLELTPSGAEFLTTFGVEISNVRRGKRPLCRACLDWSERRNHLAGGLGAALLVRIEALGWAQKTEGTRILAFSPKGEQALIDQFPTPDA